MQQLLIRGIVNLVSTCISWILMALKNWQASLLQFFDNL